MAKTRILFVCLGNIIRSPLGEKLFEHVANEAGVGEKYAVDSAGTSAYHIGERPDERMRRTAQRRGFVYDGRARQVNAQDLEDFDLVIAMDLENMNNLLALARSEEQAA
ncbi:MAG: low molecular weight phosphotyrosine protein phosphatase, partial [Anaerolineales bacterium]|nr:low molecular weight phosphotyrosine protein phosphatase [Anaerolineales bacterium]